MAPKRVKNPGKSAAAYRKNPESYRKKLAYDKKRNAKSEQKAYRKELSIARRKAGLMGQDSKSHLDMCHDKKTGKIKPCNAKKNRAKGGGKRQ